MHQLLCKPSIQQRLRIAGQILLYGSVGTASSAVVYFLQDQICQIQRLGHLVESKKRFAEALRQHGIPEATIERMRKSTFEDHIQDLENRGLVKLELVDEPPKWTSSPHKGQMYHVEYLRSAKRRTIRRVSKPSVSSHGVAEARSSLSIRMQHSWQHAVKSIITLFKRRSQQAQMRKHWVNSLEPCLLRDRFSSDAGRLTRSNSLSPSPLHRNVMRRASRGNQVAYYTQEIAPTASSIVDDSPQFLASAVDERSWLFKHNLMNRSRNLLRENDAHSSTVDGLDNVEMVFEKLVDLFAQLHPLDSAFRQTLFILSKGLNAGLVPVSEVLNRLAHLEAHTQLLAVSSKVHRIHEQPIAAGRVIKASFEIWKAKAQSAKEGDLQIMQDLFERLSRLKMVEAVQHLERQRCITPQFVTFLFSAHSSMVPAVLDNLIIAITKRSQDTNVQSVQRLTDTDLIPTINTLSDLPLQAERKVLLSTRLQHLSMSQSCYLTAVHNIERSGIYLPNNERSGMPLLVRTAYLALSDEQFLAADIRPAIEYFARCEIASRDLHLYGIARRYMLQESKSGLLRAKYLRQMSLMLSPLRASDFLHKLNVGEHNILSIAVQEMKDMISQNINKSEKRNVASKHETIESKPFIPVQSSTTATDIMVDWYHDPTGIASTDANESQGTLSEVKATMPNDLSDTTSSAHTVGQAQFTESPTRAVNRQSKEQIFTTIVAEKQQGHEEGRWAREISLMLSDADSGDLTATMTRLQSLQIADRIPKLADDKLLFCRVLHTYAATLEPDAWLDFAGTCSSNFGLFFGPKAFDRMVSRCIVRAEPSVTLQLLRQLIKLSSLQTFDVGVRPQTILKAFTAMRDKEIKEDKVSVGAFTYSLLKRVCKVNDRLVSRGLVMHVLTALDAADIDDAIIVKMYPRMMGRRWTKEHYHRFHSVRLQLRKQLLQSVHEQCSTPEALDMFSETSKADFENKSVEARNLRLANAEAALALASGNTRQVVAEFERRLVDDESLDMSLLRKATLACLKRNDFERAEDFCQRAKLKNVYVAPSQLRIVQERILNDVPLKPNAIRTMVFEWYETVASDHPQIAHAVLRTAVTRLAGHHASAGRSARLNRNDRRGLELILEIYKSDWARHVPFGIKEYTSLMTAYFKVNDLRGVRWTIATVLKLNLPISVTFMQVLNRDITALVSSLNKQIRPSAARQHSVFWRNVQTACYRRRLAQQEAIRKSQRAILNVLLYDAVHPTDDDIISITAKRRPGQLDTRLTADGRSETLDQIRLSKHIRAEALRKTLEASARAWDSIHADHARHAQSRQELDDADGDVLAVFENLTINDYKSNQRMYRDRPTLPTTAAADHTVQAIDRAWTSLDTDMLAVLKSRVHEIMQRNARTAESREDVTHDLLELVSDIKSQPRFQSVRNVDTALEQTIRNKDNIPGVEGIGEEIWRSTMEEHGQADWERAGSA